MQFQWVTKPAAHWGTVFRPFLINFHDAPLWIVIFTFLLVCAALSAWYRWNARRAGCEHKEPLPALTSWDLKAGYWVSRAFEGNGSSGCAGAATATALPVPPALDARCTRLLSVFVPVLCTAGPLFLPALYVTLDPWICQFGDGVVRDGCCVISTALGVVPHPAVV